ncbi:MAG: GAF domain-containing protein [Casimicrobiaceae bacterium]
MSISNAARNADRPRWVLAPKDWAKPARGLGAAGSTLVLVLAVFMLILDGSMVWGVWHPYGYFGEVNIDSDFRVSNVAEKSAFAEAGLRIGDVIDPAGMTLLERMAVLQDRAVPVHTQVTLPVMRGAERVILTPRAHSERLQDEPVLVYKRVAGILCILLGVALVWYRPGAATWAFFVFSLTALDYNITIASALPTLAFCFVWLSTKVIEATVAPSILLFGWAFPENQWEHVPNGIRVVAMAMFLVSAAIKLNGPLRALLFLDLGTYPSLQSLDSWITYAAVAASALGLLVAYRRSKTDRQKTLWMGAALVFAALGWYVPQALPDGAFGISHPGYFHLLRLFVPAALTYAIVRYRVLDIRMVIAHGALVSAVGGLITVAFLIVEFYFPPETEAARAIQLLVAVGAGLGLRWVHGRFHHVIEAWVFRGRHRALHAMERLAEKTVKARSLSMLVDMGTRRAKQILRLEFALVYARSPGGKLVLVGDSSAHRHFPDCIGRQDLIVRRMVRTGRPTRIQTDAHPHQKDSADLRRALAVPIVVNDQIHGVALYGFHRNGAALDDDEVGALVRVTRAASTAIDRLRMENFQRRLRSAVMRRDIRSTVPDAGVATTTDSDST